MTRRKRNTIKSLVLGVAVAAIAAPTALAEPRGPGNPVLAPAASTSMSPDDRAFNRGGPALTQQNNSPDDRSFYRGVESTNQSVSVSPDDRSFNRGIETPSVPVSLTISASDNFQWSDAGLGAAMTLALVLLLGAGAVMIQHHRHRLATY